jgi:hypothetical protein
VFFQVLMYDILCNGALDSLEIFARPESVAPITSSLFEKFLLQLLGEMTRHPACQIVDRLRVIGICIVPLDVWLHMRGCHKTNIVSQPRSH